MRSLFELLNNECNYLILRNWDDLFNNVLYGNGHEDIDILCDNLSSFIKLTKAQRIHSNETRDNFIVCWGDKRIRFDVRWVGDGYYPAEWADSMLKKKMCNEMGVFVPCQEDYCYSLMYHALFQKKSFSSEYLKKIQQSYGTFNEKVRLRDEKEVLKLLIAYLNCHSYKYVIPSDPAVYINWKYVIKSPHLFKISALIKHVLYKIKKKLGYNG